MSLSVSTDDGLSVLKGLLDEDLSEGAVMDDKRELLCWFLLVVVAGLVAPVSNIGLLKSVDAFEAEPAVLLPPEWKASS